MKTINLAFLISKMVTIVIIGLVYSYISPFLEKSTVNYAEHKHRIVYIDPSFPEEEQESIIEAIVLWNYKTNYTVIIDIVMLPAKNLDIQNGIVILPISEFTPDIIGLDEEGKSSTLGFFNPDGPIPSINIVSSRIDVYDYKTVILHELGHALGLSHDASVDGIGTLMYPSINFSADYITPYDLKRFCKIYKCDPTKLGD